MILVVDASVAAKWFVLENLHERALGLLESGEQLRAPDLIVSEVANIAWKKCLRGEVSGEQARAMAVAIGGYIHNLQPSAPLAERALDMALDIGHPVYDCLYLACAEQSGGVLITADDGLCKAVRGTAFEPLVRHLGNSGLLENGGDAPPPLRIPLSKLEKLIEFYNQAQLTHDFVHDAVTDGSEFPIVNLKEMKPYFDSTDIRRIKDFLDGLPKPERIDLLSLGWLGQGYSGTDWRTIHERAQTMIERYSDNMYLLGMLCYLKKGLALLREMHESDQ